MQIQEESSINKTKILSYKHFRLKQNIPVAQAAAKIGITDELYEMIENGYHIPSMVMTRRIAKAFNIDIESISNTLPNNCNAPEKSHTGHFPI